MLSKKFRLSSKDIPSVAKKGKRQNLKLFSFSSLPFRSPEGAKESPQVAFVVSNKIDGKATKRNKIKRRLREAVQQNLGVVGNNKIIIFAKKEIVNATFSEILSEIKNIHV